jgi:hypothetical protein
VFCPPANFFYQRDRRLTVQRLGVEQVLVAEGSRVLGQRNDGVDVERGSFEIESGDADEAAEIVGVLKTLSPPGNYRLEPLLDRLLRVEADDLVGDFGIPSELPSGGGIAPSLASKVRDASARSSTDEDTPISQRIMHDGAWYATPFLGLAAAIDDQVNRHAEFAECVAQPHELGVAALDLRLDHEEIEIAVRASLSPGVGAKQDHLGVAARGIGQPLTSLLDHRLVDHYADKVAR